MNLYPNDVRTRVSLARLITKIDEQPEYSIKIGVENASHFRSELCSAENVSHFSSESCNDKKGK